MGHGPWVRNAAPQWTLQAAESPIHAPSTVEDSRHSRVKASKTSKTFKHPRQGAMSEARSGPAAAASRRSAIVCQLRVCLCQLSASASCRISFRGLASGVHVYRYSASISHDPSLAPVRECTPYSQVKIPTYLPTQVPPVTVSMLHCGEASPCLPCHAAMRYPSPSDMQLAPLPALFLSLFHLAPMSLAHSSPSRRPGVLAAPCKENAPRPNSRLSLDECASALSCSFRLLLLFNNDAFPSPPNP